MMQDNESDKTKGSLGDELLEESEKPLTIKDRIHGVFFALMMFGLAAWMFIRPVLLSGDETADVSSRRTRGIVNLIDWAWSRPMAIFLILFGLLVIWISLTKKSASKSE
jgi:hypothetical protein